MLAQYETLTQALLQAPSSPIPLIPTATLDTYINQSRIQVAAQGACIRQFLDLALTAGTTRYNFTALTGLSTGVVGVYQVRQIWYSVPGATGNFWVSPRPFEYLTYFGAQNNPNPPSGAPQMWAQFGQGETGSLFVDPIPDLAYSVEADCLGVPATLVDDTTVEAIPAIWTLAVPYWAAWLGFMSAQRQADADMMLKRFQEQMALARAAANPDINTEAWSQSPDPEGPNRLGGGPAGRAG